MTIKLAIEPLTRAAFSPFGDVIEMAGAQHYPINQGFAERVNDLARIDTAPEGGETIVSLFRGRPRSLPIEISFVERHPLGSQAFYPLQKRDWLIVVADATMPPTGRTLRAFRAKRSTRHQLCAQSLALSAAGPRPGQRFPDHRPQGARQ